MLFTQDKNGNYNFIIPVADIERAKSELAGSPYWNTRPDSLLCSVVANEVKDSELPTQQAQATLPIEPKEVCIYIQSAFMYRKRNISTSKCQTNLEPPL